MTNLPEPQFSSWHSPTGVCNAFPWPPRIPEDEYWTAKGYHGEPLYTADQLRQYARDVLEAAAKVCESMWGDGGDANDFAQAIRAMKGEI